MKRYLLLAVLSLLLPACTIPTAAVVGVAVDSVTFLGSGKSISSHTLTAVTQRDCSLLYGITRGEFCKEKEKYYDHTSQDAGFKAPKNEPKGAKAVAPKPSKKPSVGPQAVLEPKFFDFDYETDPRAVAVEDSKPPASTVPSLTASETGHRSWTLVFGSFSDLETAIGFARALKPRPGLVSEAVVEGRIRYRVSSAPLERDQATQPALNDQVLKLRTVRLMPVCPPGAPRPNCVALDRVLVARQAHLQ